jgi:hypothetical protein
VARTNLIPELEVWKEITTGPNDLGRVQFRSWRGEHECW